MIQSLTAASALQRGTLCDSVARVLEWLWLSVACGVEVVPRRLEDVVAL